MPGIARAVAIGHPHHVTQLRQGRFYSCILDETHLLAAARYIERSPVRAGLVKKAVDYNCWNGRMGTASV